MDPVRRGRGGRVLRPVGLPHHTSSRPRSKWNRRHFAAGFLGAAGTPHFAIFGRRAVIALLVVVVTAPLTRYLLWLTLRDSLDIDYVTPARMDAIAVGCLLTFLLTGRFGGILVGWAGRRQTALFACSCLMVVLSLGAGSFSGKFGITLSRSCVAVCVALVPRPG